MTSRTRAARRAIDVSQASDNPFVQQVNAGPFMGQANDHSFSGRRIHLIGVGGCGMRALAQMLLGCGAVVSGSDMSDSDVIGRLRDEGGNIFVGQRAENIPAGCELVVHSAAINEQNPELQAARNRGLEVVKYAAMLGRLMSQKVGIAVSGTHGKSTTSGMVSYVLTAAGAEPNFIVGATVDQLGGPSGIGRGKHFVAEACEFDRSFLHLCPTVAAILNIEEDHLDCFTGIHDIIEAFRAFASRVPADGVMIANGEDRNVATALQGIGGSVEHFGLSPACHWQGANLRPDRGQFTMDVLHNGRPFVTIKTPLPGMHNVYNSLAAIAMLHHAGLDRDVIAEHLAAFTGTGRRMTLKARQRDVTVLDDYAHHPTEIQTTLRAIRDHYQPRRLLCVFQPHQHSRTRFLLKDFARCFGLADEVIVPDIYFVRDSVLERGYISSEDLVAQIRLSGGSAIYLKTFPDIVTHLQGTLGEGDLVVTMGAGNIWEVADELVFWLGRNR